LKELLGLRLESVFRAVWTDASFKGTVGGTTKQGAIAGVA
jgi:hypothetical protein